MLFWQRQDADTVSAPFTARRVLHVVEQFSGEFSEKFETYLGPVSRQDRLVGFGDWVRLGVRE